VKPQPLLDRAVKDIGVDWSRNEPAGDAILAQIRKERTPRSFWGLIRPATNRPDCQLKGTRLSIDSTEGPHSKEAEQGASTGIRNSCSVLNGEFTAMIFCGNLIGGIYGPRSRSHKTANDKAHLSGEIPRLLLGGGGGGGGFG